MNRLVQITESERARNTFYPTPEPLAERLLRGIRWERIDSVLEPSAGKGDLAKYVAGRLYYSRRRYTAHDERTWAEAIKEADIDCIEIDANLRNMLTGDGFRVVHDDFMTYETQKRYRLVVMNPPFDNGAAHLLKALDLMKRGGMICCILNAETLRNCYSEQRRELARKLKEYTAEIEFVSGAFLAGERTTDVDVALIRVNIPVVKPDSTIVEDMRKAPTYKTQSVSNEYKELVQYDAIQEWVNRYNFETACGIKLIEEYRAMQDMLCNEVNHDEYSTSILELKVYGPNGTYNDVINHYLREMRGKYWRAIFEQPVIVSKFTRNLQQELFDNVNRLKDYEFSAYNILTMIIKMNGRVINGIEDTIIALFDDWTRSYWHEDSPNRHYYNGWRTNDCFRIGKKVIIPFYGAYDSWDKKFRSYNVLQEFRDIEKVFDFLDGGRTDWIGTLDAAFAKAQEEQVTKNIDTKYFTVTIYKKGTAHLVFKDLDLLEKFNLFACQRKGWLPPNYGKKRYNDMSREEQEVVDSFHGKTMYEKVMANADYYLNSGANQMLLLGAPA